MLAFIFNFIIFASEGGHGATSEGGFGKFFNDYLNFPGFELWRFFNLAVFIVIMIYLLKKPLSNAFKAKRDAIRAELIKAEAEKQAALAELNTVETKLSSLDSESNKIIEKAKLEAEAEKTRIAQQVEFESKRLRDQANSEIERKTKQVKNELRRFSAEESVRLAEEKVRKAMNANKDAELVKAGIKSIGGLN